MMAMNDDHDIYQPDIVVVMLPNLGRPSLIFKVTFREHLTLVTE
jgi:hypothetical protein